MILTNQFNRSEYITAAGKGDEVHAEAARRGVPPDPTNLPPQVLAPDFSALLATDLSQAYTVVFVVATACVLTTLIPAAFLPKKPAHPSPGQPAMAAMAG